MKRPKVVTKLPKGNPFGCENRNGRHALAIFCGVVAQPVPFQDRYALLLFFGVKPKTISEMIND